MATTFVYAHEHPAPAPAHISATQTRVSVGFCMVTWGQEHWASHTGSGDLEHPGSETCWLQSSSCTTHWIPVLCPKCPARMGDLDSHLHPLCSLREGDSSRCVASSLVDRLVEQCHVVAVCDFTCSMFFPLSTGFHIWPQERETCSESNRSLWLFVLRAGPGWAPTGSGAQGLQPALAHLR